MRSVGFVSLRERALWKAEGVPIFEERRMRQATSFQEVLKRGREYTHSIDNAAFEIDRGRIVEIFRRAGYLTNAETKIHRLNDHLVIEHKVIGAAQ